MVLRKEDHSMRKVILNLKENKQYEVIKKLVETNGNKKRAAVKLNVSDRHINRLIKKYKKQGKEGFIHGNRNREPVNKINKELRTEIQDIYCKELYDANFRHATELLDKHYDIKISDTTLNTILRKNYIVSPKANRKTKRDMKKHLKDLRSKAKRNKDIYEIENKIDDIDQRDAHPRRPRCAYFGEMIQMDASEHVWFGNTKCHLHLAIDDATGKIVGAYFDTQETLKGYYNVLYQILTNHGIPYRFLTDKRTIFEYNLKNVPSDEEDTFTQFSYACHQLGIEIDTTSIPQAKGRIERLNGTVQSRFPVELRLKGIQSIEQANRQLPQLVKEYNDQFGLHIHDSKTVFETQPSKEEINLTLAVLSNRKIDAGHCIKFFNKYYIPTTSGGLHKYYPSRTPALIIKAFNGEMYVNINDTVFGLDEIVDRHEFSKDFDEIKEKKPRKKTIPSMHHPWRIGTFAAYIHEQKHRENGAHV